MGKRLLMLIGMYLDDATSAEGEQLVERLINVGSPATKAMTVIPFGLRVQRIINPEFPDGNRYYTKEAHINTLPEEALESLVGSWQSMTMQGEIEIHRAGRGHGPSARRRGGVPNRQNNWWLNFALHRDEESRDPDCLTQVRRAHDAFKPWLSSGVYANMLNFDESDRLLHAYGGPERYARLGRVKAEYDPDNFFRLNANIQPLP